MEPHAKLACLKFLVRKSHKNMVYDDNINALIFYTKIYFDIMFSQYENQYGIDNLPCHSNMLH